MSTNRIDIFGLVGVSAKTLQARLDSLAADPAFGEEIQFDVARRETHPLLATCKSIVEELHREKNRLPVLAHCSYIDSWTVACSHAHILGWPDDRQRFLLPDVRELWYYPEHQLQELAKRLKAFRRRKVFQTGYEFRLYCNRLSETIEAVSHVESERLIVVAPYCIGPSRTRSDVDDALKVDAFSP